MSRRRKHDVEYGGRASAYRRAGSSATPAFGRPSTASHGITLIEMLIAMAITLIMMAAVMTLFANVSDSVRNRRATIELGSQLRHVRNMLQADLANATCPGLVWQRPDHNRGYIEIIEGQWRDTNPSMLTDGMDDPSVGNRELEPETSIVPRNNVVFDYNDNGTIDDDDRSEHLRRWNSLTVRQNPTGDPDNSTNFLIASANGLGDHDDILMLTVRNEAEPFVGRVPKTQSTTDADVVRQNSEDANGFAVWGYQTLESPLAEVVWFAVENPARDADGDGIEDTGGFFGEPGMRTIYRRTLLIAPWINPYRFVDDDGVIYDRFTEPSNWGGETFRAQPGLVRIFPEDTTLAQALAGLIAFQDRYDLSVRLEFDPLLDSANGGRWKIVANTLSDLTKRENRYEHFVYPPGATEFRYPFPVASLGCCYPGSSVAVEFISDPEEDRNGRNDAEATAWVEQDATVLGDDYVTSYTIEEDNVDVDEERTYLSRPLAYVDADSLNVATARAMLNDDGQVVGVTHGLVPLSGERRGQDVVLTDVLAFDLRVYDPGAPLFGVREIPNTTTSPIINVLEPGDPGWITAYIHSDNMNGTTGVGPIGREATTYPYVDQGAYVDLGYGVDTRVWGISLPSWQFAPAIGAVEPRFFQFQPLGDVYGNPLAAGYAVYDTWSLHYENNGLNEDHDSVNATTGAWLNDVTGIPQVDEGTNGFDDFGNYTDGNGIIRLGVDDVGERETTPPYDQPLRGVQVSVRAYERDSRQIRQTTVRQQFMPQ